MIVVGTCHAWFFINCLSTIRDLVYSFVLFRFFLFFLLYLLKLGLALRVRLMLLIVDGYMHLPKVVYLLGNLSLVDDCIANEQIKGFIIITIHASIKHIILGTHITFNDFIWKTAPEVSRSDTTKPMLIDLILKTEKRHTNVHIDFLYLDDEEQTHKK